MSTFHAIMPLLAAGSLAMALFVPLREEHRRRLSATADASTHGLPPSAVSRRFDHLPVRKDRSLQEDAFRAADAVDAAGRTDRASVTTTFADEVLRVHIADGPTALIPAEADTPPAARFRPVRTQNVPLTRRALRPPKTPCTWTTLIDAALVEATCETRYNLLAGMGDGTLALHEDAVGLAFEQEEAPGRMLAIKAMRLGKGFRTRDLLIHVMRDGEDDERAAAVDALAMRGERTVVSEAVNDRIDAVAAAATLAMVGMGTRSDFEAALEPLVDQPRRDALLNMLAGLFT